jgi:hypothetical protein
VAILIRPAAFTAALIAAAALARTIPLDHPAIRYNSTRLTDPVSELARNIEAGKTQLAFDPDTGYLPALLKALEIPVSSQMAVFSKTSVQGMRIEPANPRVLFFNDAVIAGWVRGGFVELAAQDPQAGMVFYRVDQRPSAYRARTAAGAPENPFTRRTDCLHCHMSDVTLGVPGVLLRSVFPSVSGVPLANAPQYDTDSRAPFEKLWGGWYVTGRSDATHMGNRIAPDEAHPESMRRNEPEQLDSLEGKCPVNTRLTPFSDIAALMVFEHQVRMMNLLTRAGWASRMDLADAGSLGPRAHEAIRELADALLFVDEAPLKGRISGTSGFTEEFSARGPRDRNGRSLYQLSLRGRLMRYPCSYMIYSAAFDALPAPARTAIYRRMKEVLAGRGAEDRRNILEILRDTKPEFPAD